MLPIFDTTTVAEVPDCPAAAGRVGAPGTKPGPLSRVQLRPGVDLAARDQLFGKCWRGSGVVYVVWDPRPGPHDCSRL